jgi:hypothetical protein
MDYALIAYLLLAFGMVMSVMSSWTVSIWDWGSCCPLPGMRTSVS